MSCRDISHKITKQPHGGAVGKIRESPKSVKYILWEPWMSFPNVNDNPSNIHWNIPVWPKMVYSWTDTVEPRATELTRQIKTSFLLIWWLLKTCSAWVWRGHETLCQTARDVCLKRVCASLRFLPPLSETSVGAASGDGSASTPEIYDTLYSKQTGVAYIMLSNWDSPERKQLHCNSSQALTLHFDRHFCWNEW